MARDADADAGSPASLRISRTNETSTEALRREAGQGRAETLRREIAHHDELYFKNATPEITDAAYDQLKRELIALEKLIPESSGSASAADTFGDDRTGAFPLYRHRERMLSLDKSYSEKDLREFHARVVRRLGRSDLAFVVEPKYDGVAISVTYENGKFVRAVTRGNGVEGDNVTANVLALSNLPRELNGAAATAVTMIPRVVELRGEIYLPLAEFARINRDRETAGETPFAHPRNLAAGTLKQLDPREVAERKLAIVFYGLGACEPASTHPTSQQELHARIKAWGLPGVRQFSVARTADEIWKGVQAFDRERARLAFPADGAVVKLDSFAGQQNLGASDHALRSAIAYKFPPTRAETQLQRIVIQVGRTGALTPVAEFAPVELAGSRITRASLHNREEIARQDLRIGDYVYVEKAGEIIPAVVGVNLARRAAASVPYVFPDRCPACDAAVAASSNEVAVRCSNPECPAQLRRRVLHFVSDACVAIPGFGRILVDAVVEKGWVRDLPDIYRLRREDLKSLPGMGANSADKLLTAIERSKHAELWRVIYGLGIPQVGAITAKDLAREFGELAALTTATEEDLAASTGAMSAAAIVKHFAEPRNRFVVDELTSLGLRPTAPRIATGVLSGKTIVLTGTFSQSSRALLAEKIRQAGGKIAGNVSRKTNYVVAGEGSGAKSRTARDLAITVLSEAEMLEMLK